MSDEMTKDVDPKFKAKIKDRIPSLSTPMQKKILSRLKVLMEKMEKAMVQKDMKPYPQHGKEHATTEYNYKRSSPGYIPDSNEPGRKSEIIPISEAKRHLAENLREYSIKPENVNNPFDPNMENIQNMQKSGPYDSSKHHFVNADQTPEERRFKYQKARSLGMDPEDAKRFRDTHMPKMYRRLGLKVPSRKEYESELQAFTEAEKKKKSEKLLNSVKRENMEKQSDEDIRNVRPEDIKWFPPLPRQAIEHKTIPYKGGTNKADMEAKVGGLTRSPEKIKLDRGYKKYDKEQMRIAQTFGTLDPANNIQNAYEPHDKYEVLDTMEDNMFMNIDPATSSESRHLPIKEKFTQPATVKVTMYDKHPYLKNIQNAHDPVKNKYALATWRAKQKGYNDFSRGSKGRAERNKIAENLPKSSSNVEKFENIMKPQQLELNLRSLADRIEMIEKEILFTMRDEKDPEGRSIGSYYARPSDVPPSEPMEFDEATKAARRNDAIKNPNVKITGRVNISPADVAANKREGVPEGFDVAHELGHANSNKKQPVKLFRNIQDEMNADMNAYYKRGQKPEDWKYIKNKYTDPKGEWAGTSANTLYNTAMDAGKLYFKKSIENIEKQVMLKKSEELTGKLEEELLIRDFLKEYKNKLILKSAYIDDSKLYKLSERLNEIKHYNIDRVPIGVDSSTIRKSTDGYVDSNDHGLHSLDAGASQISVEIREGVQFMAVIPPTHVAHALYDEKMRTCNCTGCGKDSCVKSLSKELLSSDIRKSKGLEQSRSFWKLFETAVRQGVQSLEDHDLVVLREFLYSRV